MEKRCTGCQRKALIRMIRTAYDNKLVNQHDIPETKNSLVWLD